MSVSGGGTLPEHQLVAFWAPFLLLHLGGQDNITAYAIEDNRLWLRHLQTFVVQVLAAGYILYQSYIFGHQTQLRQATILMFLVGVIKYGERVWALKCASTSNLSGKNYQSFGRVHMIENRYNVRRSLHGVMLKAHLLLNIPMHLLKGPLPRVALEDDNWGFSWDSMYRVAEMQLFLMHEVFYGKAPVIHTWYGLCIRVISPVATGVACLLFGRSSDERHGRYYSRADVAVTYVLLVGALVLEILSVLRAMFSSWALVNIVAWQTCCLFGQVHVTPDGLVEGEPFGGCSSRVPIVGVLFKLVTTRYQRLICLAKFFLERAMEIVGLPTGDWSGSMGQHSFIHLCTQRKYNWSSKMARWLGREDWWNTLVYTSSVPVPADFRKLLEKQLLCSVGVSGESPDHIQNSRGRAVLKRSGWHEELAWSVEIQLDESILVWHIATQVYLTCCYDAKYKSRPALAMTIEVLSNYMVFLLAARPFMLPDNASRQSYVELCNKVINHVNNYNSAEDLVRLIREHGEALNTSTTGPPPPADAAETEILEMNLTFDRASKLGAWLICNELNTPDVAGAHMLNLVAQVWMEMLCYASYRCRADSHARQLRNGGEITTLVAILMEYLKSDVLKHMHLQRFVQRSENPV
ncbi:unnamed protein product [Alopecurus aequalis]